MDGRTERAHAAASRRSAARRAGRATAHALRLPAHAVLGRPRRSLLLHAQPGTARSADPLRAGRSRRRAARAAGSERVEQRRDDRADRLRGVAGRRSRRLRALGTWQRSADRSRRSDGDADDPALGEVRQHRLDAGRRRASITCVSRSPARSRRQTSSTSAASTSIGSATTSRATRSCSRTPSAKSCRWSTSRRADAGSSSPRSAAPATTPRSSSPTRAAGGRGGPAAVRGFRRGLRLHRRSGGRLYFRTTKGAPLGRIIAVDPRHGVDATRSSPSRPIGCRSP